MQMTKSHVALATTLALIACESAPAESGTGKYKRFRIGSSVQQRPQMNEIRAKRKSQRQAKKRGRK